MATRDDEKLSSAVDRADISGKEGNEDELLSVVVALTYFHSPEESQKTSLTWNLTRQ